MLGFSVLLVQRVYLDRAQEYLAHQEHDPILDDVWQRWAMVLDKLEEDPMQLVREIDWVTKRHLIQSYIDKKGCGWDDPRVFLLDLQFHDVKRTRGLYYLMESRGLIERVVEEEAVQRAMSTPPQTTRAKVRGDFIRFARRKSVLYGRLDLSETQWLLGRNDSLYGPLQRRQSACG